MLFFIVGCLGANLNGDSVFPAQEEPDLSFNAGSDSEEVGASSGDSSLSSIDYQESASSDVEPGLFVEILSGKLSVVHNGVSLSCDMSQYDPTLNIDETTIEVMYMPLEDQRDCSYNISFQIYHNLVGEYVLRVMDDEHSVVLQ